MSASRRTTATPAATASSATEAMAARATPTVAAATAAATTTAATTADHRRAGPRGPALPFWRLLRCPVRLGGAGDRPEFFFHAKAAKGREVHRCINTLLELYRRDPR